MKCGLGGERGEFIIFYCLFVVVYCILYVLLYLLYIIFVTITQYLLFVRFLGLCLFVHDSNIQYQHIYIIHFLRFLP